jgi:glutamine phosphoribosylpyrophosphate amidotransferase
MCGICGFVSAEIEAPISAGAILAMRETLAHRGPDDAGEFLAAGVALGARRLSILDLSSRGHMPMRSEQGRHWIAYNGEVYNYRELRALLYATESLEGFKGANDDQTRGIDIIRQAIMTPLRQIAENAGHDGAVVSGNLLREGDQSQGFNAATDTYENLVLAGVIDPTKVVRTALQDAASVAGLLITTEAAISETPEDKSAPAMPDMGGMGGGMGF